MIYSKKLKILNSILIVSLSLIPAYGIDASAKERQILTVEEIKKGAESHLFRTLPWAKESLEIEIYYQGGEIALPPGKRYLIYKGGEGRQNVGRIPLVLQIKVDGTFVRHIGLNTRVRVTQKVVKTIRSIRKGELFSLENINVETIKTERLLTNTIEFFEQALGFEAVRNLPNGKIILQREMKKPNLGNKGDKVLLLAEKGQMKITTPGILKEDGYKNAMVRVLNLESNKTIYGRLVDSNTVKVSF